MWPVPNNEWLTPEQMEVTNIEAITYHLAPARDATRKKNI